MVFAGGPSRELVRYLLRQRALKQMAIGVGEAKHPDHILTDAEGNGGFAGPYWPKHISYRVGIDTCQFQPPERRIGVTLEATPHMAERPFVELLGKSLHGRFRRVLESLPLWPAAFEHQR